MIKTQNDLKTEIAAGDCIIRNNIRFLSVARIKVTCQRYELVEVKQTRKDDGSIQRRNYVGVSEKLKIGELPMDGAVRGIKEELGIDIPANFLIPCGVTFERKESPSYPGLISRYKFFDFSLELPLSEFREVYRADEGDMITEFRWRFVGA